MESNMIVFFTISFSGMFILVFFSVLEFPEERNDYQSKIRRLESEKFEMEHRLKNQSATIQALMNWKEEKKP